MNCLQIAQRRAKPDRRHQQDRRRDHKLPKQLLFRYQLRHFGRARRQPDASPAQRRTQRCKIAKQRSRLPLTPMAIRPDHSRHSKHQAQ